MFAIVSYPWPVPSAHVELTGPSPALDNDATGNRANAEKLVSWTCQEWLRISWYRLRLSIRGTSLGG